MTDCKYCHKEMKKDDDFVLVGKYPSGWQKLQFSGFLARAPRSRSPEEFGMIYHKSCFLEMMKNEGVKP